MKLVDSFHVYAQILKDIDGMRERKILRGQVCQIEKTKKNKK